MTRTFKEHVQPWGKTIKLDILLITFLDKLISPAMTPKTALNLNVLFSQRGDNFCDILFAFLDDPWPFPNDYYTPSSLPPPPTHTPTLPWWHTVKFVLNFTVYASTYHVTVFILSFPVYASTRHFILSSTGNVLKAILPNKSEYQNSFLFS